MSQENKKKVICVTGTRPEAIKMAPLVTELKRREYFIPLVLATGQHTDMLYGALSYFDIKPDFDLAIMKEKQSLDYITSQVLTGTGKIFDEVKPDIVLVHGDTTTTFASALSAFYRNIPVGHIEAGLRSYNMKLPFPEEANRVLTDRLCSFWFAPTARSADNLVREGSSSELVYITGNTVIDALWKTVDKIKNTAKYPFRDILSAESRVLLMTLHRRESWGKPLKNLCNAVKRIIEKNPDLWLVLPVHKNPLVRDDIFDIFKDTERVILTEAMDYQDFVAIMSRSFMIITDSGGLQEEGSSLKIPVLVTRDVSERPEAFEEGTAILVGQETAKLEQEINKLLNNSEYYDEIVRNAGNPFGNGNASEIICDILEKRL